MGFIRKLLANTYESISSNFEKKPEQNINPENFEKFEKFCRIPLFKEINKDKLIILYNLTSEIELVEGEYLFHEGDEAKDFFIVMEGSLAITKESKKIEKEHLLTVIEESQTIGELGLIDHAPRSASVRSIVPSKLLRIKFETVHELVKKDRIFDRIYKHISANITKRLRQTNEITIKALENQIDEYKLRVIMGIFMIYTVSGICLYTFSLAGLEYLEKHLASSSYVTLPISFTFFILFCLLIKVTRLPLSSFGFTLRNARKAVTESFFYTLIFCVFILLLKYIELLILPSYANRRLFEPFALVHGTSSLNDLTIWGITLMLYCLVVSPMQEIIARGGLQSSLDMFLVSRYKTLITIIVSNLLFSMAHLFISFKTSIFVFFPGLFLGWLYSRHKTLIGVYISHMMLGIWTMWIVGLF